MNLFKERPFFSVVIPVYNGRKYIEECLWSLVNQCLPKDMMEVIICDDCSPEPCWDIIDEFKDDLNIITATTDYNFAPGNTREKAMEYVTGEWVTFIDQDDFFVDDTFWAIKEQIIQSNEKYCAASDFVEVNKKTNEIMREHDYTSSWNHGKFYNMDNLWKPYNIHFKKDMVSHEDVYISSQINMRLNKIGVSPLHLNTVCYIWIYEEESLSHHLGGGPQFLNVHFKDYIDATGNAWIDGYNSGIISKEQALDFALITFGFIYFYFQSILFYVPDYNKENIYYIRDYMKRIKEIFNISNEDIYMYFAINNAFKYMDVFDHAFPATGRFIPQMTLMEYIDYMNIGDQS